MSRRRLLVVRAAALASVGAGAYYLSWRVQEVADLGVPAWFLLAGEIAGYCALLMAIVLLCSPYRRPPAGSPPTGATLDVVITVCGESVEMVRATILAALTIDYPHRTVVLNDGRIARRRNWRKIEDLCAELGVFSLARTSGVRGKAGNLNAALPYLYGEFIVTLDADHRARPELAQMLLGHFKDPEVALVSSHQSFELDRSDMLGHREALFYRSIQPAKDRDNAAFSCGSGVAYRRAAIDSIGGFSEWSIVEDLHTSYELHSLGWSSAYVETPVSVGTAPGTAAEMANQRMRWAIDSLRIFFWDNPLRKPNLTVRQRLHYLHTTGWYLLQAAQIVFVLSPAASALLGLKLLEPGTELTHLGLLAVYLGSVGVLLAAHVGWRSAARAAQLYTYLTPAFVIAIVRALWARPGRSTGRRWFGVTRKVDPRRVSSVTLFQHLILASLLVAIGWAFADPSPARWPVVLWTCLMAVMLATPGSMVGLARDGTQTLRIAMTAPAAAAAALVALSLWATGASDARIDPGGGLERAATEVDARTRLARPALGVPRNGIYLGVHHDSLHESAERVSFRRYPGARIRLVHRFQDWWGYGRYMDRRWMDHVARSGAVPVITWEPWRARPDLVATEASRGVTKRIAAGRYDVYIRRWARDAVRYGKPLVLRFMHEMNGYWYPWSARAQGNTPASYRAAWRHTHDIFRRAGATNVSWVFSVQSFGGGPDPAGGSFDDYYPGRRYVDWIGLSGFNWAKPGLGRIMSFQEVFDGVYNVMKGYNRPIMLAEVGTANGSLARGQIFVRDALRKARSRYPKVKAIVWYDARHPQRDFRMSRPIMREWLEASASAPLRPELELRCPRGGRCAPGPARRRGPRARPKVARSQPPPAVAPAARSRERTRARGRLRDPTGVLFDASAPLVPLDDL